MACPGRDAEDDTFSQGMSSSPLPPPKLVLSLPLEVVSHMIDHPATHLPASGVAVVIGVIQCGCSDWILVTAQTNR